MDQQDANETSPSLSVVVPVYNGAETLRECLTALCEQTLPADKYEILVIDDGSTDETPEIIASFAPRVRCHRLERNLGRLIARQRAAELATCDDIVFCDCRVIFEPDVLEKVLAHPKRPLMFGSDFPEEYFRTLYGRFLFCVHRSLWKPYFPQEWYGEELEITRDNFDDVPKGMGAMATDRAFFLRHQPAVSDRYVSDDTLLFAGMVAEKPIIRYCGMKCHYRARTELRTILPHLHFRGILFNSFYLRPRHRFFRLYLGMWAVMIALVALTATGVTPWWIIPASVAAGVVGAAAILADGARNFLAILAVLPPVAACFASGILRGHMVDLRNGLRRLFRRGGKGNS